MPCTPSLRASALRAPFVVGLGCAIGCAIGCATESGPAADEDPTGTVSSALTSVVVEAESAVGTGTVVADPTASGGAVRTMVSPNEATASFTVSSPVLGASVTMRGGACTIFNTIHPVIVVDGITVFSATISTSSTLATYDFPITLAAGTHTVRFENSGSCPVSFDKATFPLAGPLVIEAEGSTGAPNAGDENDPSASGGKAFAMSASSTIASKTFTVPNGLVTTSGTARIRTTGCTAASFARVFLDGVNVFDQTVTTSTWTDFPLTTQMLGMGTHTVAFGLRFSTPCVVHFDDVTLDLALPLVVEAENKVAGTAVVEADTLASGGEAIKLPGVDDTSTSTFTLANPTTKLGIRMKTSGCGSTFPVPKIIVDGVTSSTPNPVIATTWTELFVPKSLASGSHFVAFAAQTLPTGCTLHFDKADFSP